MLYRIQAIVVMTCLSLFSLPSGKIRSLAYSTITRKLISTSDDNMLGVWDMDTDREEVSKETRMLYYYYYYLRFLSV